MARLELDLVRRRPAWPPWLALVVGLALAADAGLQWLGLRDEVATLQQRGSARPARAVAAEPVSEETQRELAGARRLLEELALPWEALFRSIEGAVDRDTALLSVEPDAGRRAVQISGEARDYPAVLRFMERLEKGPALARVHLLSHEVRQDDADRPTLFTLAASWKVAP